MQQLFAFLLCIAPLTGCAATAADRYVCGLFEADLPESFEPVPGTPILCFAPMGDPVRSSSVTCYTTERNWYFDSFTQEEYETALRSLTGYETLSVNDIASCRVDGCNAKRIACSVGIDQGTHDLILYAIESDQTYIFTLLNRDTDSYIDAFDDMMRSLKLKGNS